MARATLAAWAAGQSNFKAVLELPQPGYLSFVNLTEAFVLHAMRRQYRLQMPRIRDAISYVERELGVDHPLAFEQFRTDYVDLFVRTAGGDLNVSRRGQTSIVNVSELDRIEWRKERPIALFPVFLDGRDFDRRPIRISPLVAFGQPVLTGTRIPTRAVAERFFGGESVTELAQDFDVASDAIEDAVRAESKPAAA